MTKTTSNSIDNYYHTTRVVENGIVYDSLYSICIAYTIFLFGGFLCG